MKVAIPLAISAILLSTVLVAGGIDSVIEEPTLYDEWKKFNLITYKDNRGCGNGNFGDELSAIILKLLFQKYNNDRKQEKS